MLVHEVSGKGAGVDIINAHHRTECKRGFVFQPARGVPVLLAILDRKVILPDMGDPAAGDGAAKTGLVGKQVGMTRFISLEHSFGINLVITIKLDLLEVVGWQAPELLHGVHHGIGAVLGQPAALLSQQIFHLVGDFHEALRILDPHTARTTHRYRFKILGPHHRTDTGSAGCPVQIVDYRCVAHATFPRNPDGGNLQHGIVMLLFDPLVGLPDGLAPDLVRAGKTDLVSLDQKVDGLFRAPFDQQKIKTCVLELGAELTTAVGAGDGAGEGPFGDHRVAPARRRTGSGERPGRKNEYVVRTHRIGFGIHVFPEILGTQTPFTDVIVSPLHVEGFGSHLS